MRISVETSALDKLEQDLEEMVLLAVKKIALTGFRKIVLRSPVDVGHFRMNWSVTVGNPSSGTVEGADRSGSIAIAKGSETILGLKELQTTFFTNNLPYARRLENGWSGQAPSGMVAITLAEISLMGQAV